MPATSTYSDWSTPSGLDFLRRSRLPLTVALLACTLLSLLVSTVMLTRQLGAERTAVAERFELNIRLRLSATVLDLLSDAETGQRGFLLTEKVRYLQPYERAIGQLPRVLHELQAASRADVDLQVHLRALQVLVDLKLAELMQTLQIYRTQGRDAAIALVQTDAGQVYMEKARQEIAATLTRLSERRDALSLQVLRSNTTARYWAIATAVALLIAGAVVACQLRTLLRRLANSQERFRTMAVHSEDIIATLDEQGCWTYVSPACQTLLGYHPGELVGQQRLSFVHPDDVASLQQQIAAGNDLLASTVRARHKAGHYVWLELKSRRICGVGVPATWVTNARDVSERKRVEQLKNDFISTVNHELRTPLTSILGAIGLAVSGKAGEMDESARRLLTIAKGNCDRLAQLVNDILDFEKASSGNMQFELSACEVDELVTRSIAATASYVQKYKVTVRARHRVPHTRIAVDCGRFEQVMANLLSNAAKFSATGGMVEVDASVAHGRCRVSVIDHGCGIPQRFQPTLFERFTQAEANNDRARGGTGLGMAIAKQMTQAMGGSISFESEEGVGTTFHLDFALVSAEPVL